MALQGVELQEVGSRTEGWTDTGDCSVEILVTLSVYSKVTLAAVRWVSFKLRAV